MSCLTLLHVSTSEKEEKLRMEVTWNSVSRDTTNTSTPPSDPGTSTLDDDSLLCVGGD